jgi:hypothetical protein
MKNGLTRTHNSIGNPFSDLVKVYLTNYKTPHRRIFQCSGGYAIRKEAIGQRWITRKSKRKKLIPDCALLESSDASRCFVIDMNFETITTTGNYKE